MAVHGLVAELAAQARRERVADAAFTAVGGAEAVRRIKAGEEVDVVVLASAAVDGLVDGRFLLASSRRAVADSAMGVAVPANAPPPQLNTEAELRQAVLLSPALGYSTGPSGEALLALLHRWGIYELLAERLVQAPPGMPVARLLAQGRADLGFQQLSELSGVDRVHVVGPMPPGCEVVTTFVGAVTSSAARAPERLTGAVALLEFLASPETSDVKERHGLRAPASAPEPAEQHR